MQAADVVNTEHGGFFFGAQSAVLTKRIAEEVVASNHNHVIVNISIFQNQVQIADRAEFVVITGGVIVHHPHRRGEVGEITTAGPILKMSRELFVGHDERLVDGLYRPEAGQDMIDHRLAGDRQQRLGSIESERVKARGVTGG